MKKAFLTLVAAVIVGSASAGTIGLWGNSVAPQPAQEQPSTNGTIGLWGS